MTNRKVRDTVFLPFYEHRITSSVTLQCAELGRL